MLARTLVSLEPEKLHHLGAPPESGPAVHAALLKALSATDPERAKQLHNLGGSKPFAVTGLYAGSGPEGFGFQIGTVDDALQSAFTNALEQQETIRIAGSNFRVTHFDRATEDWADLLSVAQKRWALRLLSPVTFRTSRENGARRAQPLPTPEAVFGSLLRRWQRFADISLPTQTAQVIDRHLTITDAALETVRYLTKSPNIYEVGSIGEVTYTAVSPNDCPTDGLRGVTALVRLGTYMGIGDQTTKGMGFVIPAGNDDQ